MTERAGRAAALTDPAVGAAVQAIHREPERSWAVESLGALDPSGALGGLSRAAFARHFAAPVGHRSAASSGGG